MVEPSLYKGQVVGSSPTMTTNPKIIEPWIINAARELAMDSAHIPAIARIIERHAAMPNDGAMPRRQTEK